MEKYFISNDIVRSTGEKASIISQMIEGDMIRNSDSSKALEVLFYMNEYTTRSNKVVFTLRKLVEECGYVYKRGKNSSQGVFKNILSAMDSYGLLGDNNYDFQTISPSEFIEVPASELLSVSDKGMYNKFVIITKEEREVIYKASNVDNSNLLLLFTSIKSRINDQTGVCYPTKEQLSLDTGLSIRAIQQYIELLQELDLMLVDNAGTYSKTIDGKQRNVQAANTYALKSNTTAIQDIRSSIEYHNNTMTKDYGWNSNLAKEESVVLLDEIDMTELEYFFG